VALPPTHVTTSRPEPDLLQNLLSAVVGGLLVATFLALARNRRWARYTWSWLVAHLRLAARRLRRTARSGQAPTDPGVSFALSCRLGHGKSERGPGLEFYGESRDGSNRHAVVDGERVRVSDIRSEKRYLYFRVSPQSSATFDNSPSLVAVEYRVPTPDKSEVDSKPSVSLRYQATDETYSYAEQRVRVDIFDRWQWASFILKTPRFRQGQDGADFRVACNHPSSDIDFDFMVRRAAIVKLT
jgi:hypothetical protein